MPTRTLAKQDLREKTGTSAPWPRQRKPLSYCSATKAANCHKWLSAEAGDKQCSPTLCRLASNGLLLESSMLRGVLRKMPSSHLTFDKAEMGYVRSIELAAGRLNGGQHTQWKGKEKGGAKGGAKGAKGGFKGYGKEAPRPRTAS